MRPVRYDQLVVPLVKNGLVHRYYLKEYYAQYRITEALMRENMRLKNKALRQLNRLIASKHRPAWHYRKQIELLRDDEIDGVPTEAGEK